MLYWMERMDMGWGYLDRDYAPWLTMRPSEYARRNCYLTAESNEPVLPEAFDEIGEDKLLMSSDYPHWDTGSPDCLTEVPQRNDLSASQKERFMGANIAELMRIS